MYCLLCNEYEEGFCNHDTGTKILASDWLKAKSQILTVAQPNLVLAKSQTMLHKVLI